MFYGNFSFDDVSINNDLVKLKNLISFESSSEHILELDQFSGGVLISNNLPYSYTDFCFCNKINSCVVLFSGNIYNKEQFRAKYKLNKDITQAPQLIYNLYKLAGPDFVKDINGDFAFAIYDSIEGNFFLFRDHLGIHPLAYTFKNQSIWFLSDSISLSRCFYANEVINTDVLLKEYKMVDFTIAPNSKVKKLLPGHYLKFNKNKTEIIKYWYPERIKTDKKLSPGQMISDMDFLVNKAVEIRSDKKFVAATHISGGLDSGIVAALSRKAYSNQPDFYGFSWSPDPNYKIKNKYNFDERILVQEQCKLNNINPVFITIDKSNYLSDIKEPSRHTDFIEENEIHREAVKKKINLIFSGYGGDEFLSKADRGIDTDLFLNLQWKSFLEKNPLSKPKKIIRTLFFEIAFPFLGLLSKQNKRHIKSATYYFKNKFRKPHKKTIGKFYFYTSRKKLQLGFLYCYYLPERIEDWFIKGGISGIEYRYPLLDKDIVEYVLKIPSGLLFEGEYSRIIIRKISNGLLPESIRWRKSGVDPIAYSTAKKNVLDSGIQIIDEIDQLQKNADLFFINFEKIKVDIKKYNQSKDNKKFEDLLYTLYYIKKQDEFTKAYRNI